MDELVDLAKLVIPTHVGLVQFGGAEADYQGYERHALKLSDWDADQGVGDLRMKPITFPAWSGESQTLIGVRFFYRDGREADWMFPSQMLGVPGGSPIVTFDPSLSSDW